MRIRKMATLGLVPVIIMSGAAVLSAAPAWAASCYVSGNAPYTSGTQVYGKANRASCGDRVELQAWIMEDVSFAPDNNMGYGAATLINGSVTGSGPCSRYGRGNYFTSARTDTGQRNDAGQRVSLC